VSKLKITGPTGTRVVEAKPGAAVPVEKGEKVEYIGDDSSLRKNILCVGYEGPDGIVVTDILTNRMPKMNQAQLAELSWKLHEFFQGR
jgi:hypothetical protein